MAGYHPSITDRASIKRDADYIRFKLSHAIRRLEDEHGEVPPCTGDWESLYDRERQYPVSTYAGCHTCPIVGECDRAGRWEQFGIWGGVQREDISGPNVPTHPIKTFVELEQTLKMAPNFKYPDARKTEKPERGTVLLSSAAQSDVDMVRAQLGLAAATAQRELSKAVAELDMAARLGRHRRYLEGADPAPVATRFDAGLEEISLGLERALGALSTLADAHRKLRDDMRLARALADRVTGLEERGEIVRVPGKPRRIRTKEDQ